MKHTKSISLFFAVTVTLIAVAMTAAAGMDRGGSALDKTLLVGLSIVITIGAHLLLALSRKKVVWVLWAGCLALTIFNHVTFFTNSTLRAGEDRSKSSLSVMDNENQIQRISQSINQIVARPITVISREISTTSDKKLLKALRDELQESERKASLESQLFAIQSQKTTAINSLEKDPTVALLGKVTGSNDALIALLAYLITAVLLETIGALLWFEVLAVTQNSNASNAQSNERSNAITHITVKEINKLENPLLDQSNAVTQNSNESNALSNGNSNGSNEQSNAVTQSYSKEIMDVEDDLERLKAAIESGACKPTVSAIRLYLGISQNRAMEIKKQLSISSAA